MSAGTEATMANLHEGFLGRVRRLVKVRRQELLELGDRGELSPAEARIEIELVRVERRNVALVRAFRGARVAAMFERYLDEGQVGVYALAGGQVVGHAWAILCGAKRRLADGYRALRPGEGLIHFCCVAEACRGNGIFQAMLTALCRALFEEAGVRRIVSDVEEGNAASRRAFEKVGFQWVGRRLYVQVGPWLLFERPLAGRAPACVDSLAGS